MNQTEFLSYTEPRLNPAPLLTSLGLEVSRFASRRGEQVDAVMAGADAETDRPEGFGFRVRSRMAARVDVSGPHGAVGQ
jgi:hypothetical protein